MSQQLTAGRGGQARGGGGGGSRNRFGRARGAQVKNTPRAFKSSTKEIEDDTFNTGASKYAAQFGVARLNIANYLQKKHTR